MSPDLSHDEKDARHNATDVERGEQHPGTPSETATLEAPAEAKAQKADHPVNKRDFGLIPIPKYLRVEKDRPPRFDIVLNVLFGIASTFSEYRTVPWDRGLGSRGPSRRPKPMLTYDELRSC